MRLNVFNEYTYTLETIVQAGRSKIAMDSVPIRTNEELRPSRLFHSIFGYVKKSVVTIIKAFMMYKPMTFFATIGSIILALGVALGVRFLIIYFGPGRSSGHVQSLILCSTLILLGAETIILGFMSSLIATNRKILEDIQYRIRDIDYRLDDKDGKSAKED